MKSIDSGVKKSIDSGVKKYVDSNSTVNVYRQVTCASCGALCKTQFETTKGKYVEPPQPYVPACKCCVKVGVVRSSSDRNLVRIYRRVVEFYRRVLNIVFTPELLKHSCEPITSGNLSNPFLVLESIPVKLVNYFVMNFRSDNTGMHQLGRCDCRVAIRKTTKEETRRWVKGITISRALSYEALGGVIAHELMHAYMWLVRSGGSTVEEEEAIANMASIAYLQHEAVRIRLKSTIQNVEKRESYQHRLYVCEWRIKKAQECQVKTKALNSIWLA